MLLRCSGSTLTTPSTRMPLSLVLLVELAPLLLANPMISKAPKPIPRSSSPTFALVTSVPHSPPLALPLAPAVLPALPALRVPLVPLVPPALLDPLVLLRPSLVNGEWSIYLPSFQLFLNLLDSGGIGWSGPTACADSTCTVVNAYYSQCL
jgi:hypothetical protein